MSRIILNPNSIRATAGKIADRGNLVHLLDDIGIYKSSLKRSFYLWYGDRTNEPDCGRAAELLERRGQLYTLDEVELLACYLTSSHDACVTDNPDDYSRIEVWRAEQNERNAEYVHACMQAIRAELAKVVQP